MRVAVDVVQPPVVDVVDHLVAGDATRAARPVCSATKRSTPRRYAARRVRLAREVLRVHLEDARDVDAARGVVDPAVPLAGEELARWPRAACSRMPSRVVGLRPHRRAAVRAAVDREVDARLARSAPRRMLVLDVVEADRRPPATCRRRWKNWPSRAFHTELIGYSAMIACERERVVGVDPVGEGVLLAGEALRGGLGARASRASRPRASSAIAPRGERLVVHLPVRRDDLGEEAASSPSSRGWPGSRGGGG